MRDQLSELRRDCWMMYHALEADIAALDARIAAAEHVVDTAAQRELEQVYNAQHELHGARCTLSALLACKHRLSSILDPDGSLARHERATHVRP